MPNWQNYKGIEIPNANPADDAGEKMKDNLMALADQAEWVLPWFDADRPPTVYDDGTGILTASGATIADGNATLSGLSITPPDSALGRSVSGPGIAADAKLTAVDAGTGTAAIEPVPLARLTFTNEAVDATGGTVGTGVGFAIQIKWLSGTDIYNNIFLWNDELFGYGNPDAEQEVFASGSNWLMFDAAEYITGPAWDGISQDPTGIYTGAYGSYSITALAITSLSTTSGVMPGAEILLGPNQADTGVKVATVDSGTQVTSTAQIVVNLLFGGNLTVAAFITDGSATIYVPDATGITAGMAVSDPVYGTVPGGTTVGSVGSVAPYLAVPITLSANISASVTFVNAIGPLSASITDGSTTVIFPDGDGNGINNGAAVIWAGEGSDPTGGSATVADNSGAPSSVVLDTALSASIVFESYPAKPLSPWLDTSASPPNVYDCVDNSTGAAIWRERTFS